MSSMDLDAMLPALTELAKGAMAGRQQFQQEQEADQQRQQEMALRLAPLAQNLQQQYGEQQQAPWNALAPHLASFDPGSRATILGHLATPPTGVAPGVTALQSAFPSGEAAGDVLRRLTGAAGAPQPQWRPAIGPMAQPTPPNASQQAGFPAPVEGGMVAPGGVPGAPPGGLTSFRGPGGEQLTLQGVSDNDRRQLGQRVAQIDRQLQNADLTPQEREALMTRRQNLNLNPQTPEDYRQSLLDLGSLETIAYSRGSSITGRRETEFRNTGAVYQTRYNRLTGADPKTAPMSALDQAGELVNLYDMEKKYKGGGGEEATGVVLPSFAGDAKLIDEQIRPGLAPDATPEARQAAVKASRELLEAHKAQKTTADAVKETSTVMRVLGTMSPRELADPQTRYRTLVAAGVSEEAATRVADPKARFGGAIAERGLRELLNTAHNYKDAPPEVRQFLADEIVGAARATGKKVTITAADLQNFDPLSVLKLKNAQKELEIRGSQLQKDALTLKTDQWKYDNLLPAQLAEVQARTKKIEAGGKGKAGQAGLLTQGQTLKTVRDRETEAGKRYDTFLRGVGKDLSLIQQYSPGPVAQDMIKAGQMDPVTGEINRKKLPTVDEQQVGASLWWQWDRARTKTQNLLKSMGVDVSDNKLLSQNNSTQQKQTQQTGGTQAGERDQQQTVTINGRQITASPAQYWETIQKGVRAGYITPQRANQMMGEAFPGR